MRRQAVSSTLLSSAHSQDGAVNGKIYESAAETPSYLLHRVIQDAWRVVRTYPIAQQKFSVSKREFPAYASYCLKWRSVKEGGKDGE